MSTSSAQSDWSLYPYDPVKPLPILFACLVFTVSIALVYQSLIRYKWKYFGLVVVWASSVWIAGFSCRAYSQWHVQDVDMFIAQYVLILVGPPLYAAAVYAVLSRLMHYLPYHAPIHPGRVISTFIFLSAAVESLTAAGASNFAGGTDRNDQQRKNGLALIKAGLILQACVEILFSSMVFVMQRRSKAGGQYTRNVATVCYVLYITSFMMLVRCLVRVVEGFETGSCDTTAQGYNGYCGYVSQHEWMLWVFEAANILLFLIAFAIFSPGRFLPGNDKVYLDPRDGRTERMGPGFAKADKRPWYLSAIDPFDFIGILTGRGHTIAPFWDDEHAVEYQVQHVHTPKTETRP